MPLIHHQKLVRDNIPSIVSAQGRTAVIRTLNGPEYASALMAKLHEEVAEFSADPSMEELADILEVVYALAERFGGGTSALESSRRIKREQRGGFENRIFLESTYDAGPLVQSGSTEQENLRDERGPSHDLE